MKTNTFNYTWIKKVNKQNKKSKSSGFFKKFLKLLVPILAIGSLTMLFIWAFELSNSNFPKIIERSENGIKDVMIGPKLYTNDYKNKPLEIKARSASKVEKNDKIILLEHPQGNTSLTKKNTLNFTAKQGIYNRSIGKLNLSQEVHLWSTKGTNFFTEKVTYNIDTGEFSGKNDIFLMGPWGNLKGRGFVFRTKSSIVIINGKPTLTLKIENKK